MASVHYTYAKFFTGHQNGWDMATNQRENMSNTMLLQHIYK